MDFFCFFFFLGREGGLVVFWNFFGGGLVVFGGFGFFLEECSGWGFRVLFWDESGLDESDFG